MVQFLVQVFVGVHHLCNISVLVDMFVSPPTNELDHPQCPHVIISAFLGPLIPQKLETPLAGISLYIALMQCMAITFVHNLTSRVFDWPSRQKGLIQKTAIEHGHFKMLDDQCLQTNVPCLNSHSLRRITHLRPAATDNLGGLTCFNIRSCICFLPTNNFF